MAAPPAGQASATESPIRVLFADDSASIRTLAGFALSARHGFLVVGEAADGAAAVDLYDEHQPDCVVLDIEMPGVGGFGALAEIRRRGVAVPVVMLSGSTNPETRTRAMAEGASAYLGKDEMTLLAETIRRVTGAAAGSAPLASGESPSALPDTSDAPNGHADRITGRASVSSTKAERVAAAERLADELRRLEYLLGHDFAEPARIIRGFAMILQSQYAEELDARGQMFLSHIQGAGERLQSMVDDLVVFSRAGRAELRSQVVDVQECATEACRALADTISERLAAVEVAALPRAVGDPAAITTVLQHVVLNALTFNLEATPSVQIAGRASSGSAIYTVTDNGIGVRPADLESAFELFRRLNTREEYPGTGTGLSLCRRLMEQQGGTIVLSSPPGGGSTVTLTLPTAPPPEC